MTKKAIFGSTTCWTLKQTGHSSRKPVWVPLRSAKNWKLSLQYARARQSWTTEDSKILSGDDESAVTFRWYGQNWCEQHESMDAWCYLPSPYEPTSLRNVASCHLVELFEQFEQLLFFSCNFKPTFDPLNIIIIILIIIILTIHLCF